VPRSRRRPYKHAILYQICDTPVRLPPYLGQRSKLQTEIALSTTESEYIALSTTESEYIALSQAIMREVIPLMEIRKDINAALQLKEVTPVIKCTVFEDNNGALELATAPKMRPREQSTLQSNTTISDQKWNPVKSRSFMWIQSCKLQTSSRKDYLRLILSDCTGCYLVGKSKSLVIAREGVLTSHDVRTKQ
jgi:hypothetical protein